MKAILGLLAFCWSFNCNDAAAQHLAVAFSDSTYQIPLMDPSYIGEQFIHAEVEKIDTVDIPDFIYLKDPDYIINWSEEPLYSIVEQDTVPFLFVNETIATSDSAFMLQFNDGAYVETPSMVKAYWIHQGRTSKLESILEWPKFRAGEMLFIDLVVVDTDISRVDIYPGLLIRFE